jgi:hypothetical protein
MVLAAICKQKLELGTVVSIGYIVMQFGENLEGTIIRGLLSKAQT